MLPLDDPSTIESTKSKIELAPVWKVIVLNDPVNLMNYVVLVFVRFLDLKSKEQLSI